MLNERRLTELKSTAREHLDSWEGRWVDVIGPSTTESPALKPVYGRSMDLLWKFVEAEVTFFLGDRSLEAAIPLLQGVASLAADYLTGDWRVQAIRDDRECLDWIDQMRFGLLASLLCEDELSLERIAGYVLSEPEFETGAFGRTKQDAAVYRLAFASIANSSLGAPPKISSTRAKNFAAVVMAAVDKNECHCQKAFERYMKHYKQREHDEKVNIVFSVDGSILVELARKFDVILETQSHESFLFVH